MLRMPKSRLPLRREYSPANLFRKHVGTSKGELIPVTLIVPTVQELHSTMINCFFTDFISSIADLHSFFLVYKIFFLAMFLTGRNPYRTGTYGTVSTVH